MQDNGSKFPFSSMNLLSNFVSAIVYFVFYLFSWFNLHVDQLKPVFDLLSSWQKIELGSWPGLVDEVMDQYEHNAGKVSGNSLFSIIVVFVMFIK